MELKDFIKGTITAIIESVSELNNELADKGVIIAPRNAQLAIQLTIKIYLSKPLLKHPYTMSISIFLFLSLLPLTESLV